ncbi:stalk domain-containing protein [Paenibacillus sp. UNC451MF]|uniref:stalk domain-containing protein n=1 Tax=Paenibacillus sp. UNC451MF TaxID=1449063 RepID=UPI00048ED9DB|nr:stalk domain-containing protein [Paenibacillus sp. UNC451MF]
MTKVVAVIGLWISVCFAFSFMIYAQDNEPAATYISPEGIRFQSYSSKWGPDKLRGLYEILLQCEHGEELNQLKQVTLYPDKSIGKSGYRVGYYSIKNKSIDLYEVDSVPIERTFIHEYGHHFTYYWLHKKEGIYPAQLTEASQWSQIRQLDGYPIRWSGSTLPYSHKWDPEEIMAEDYVLLFGIDSRPMPERPSDVVNWLRHENDYIPSVLSIPAVRRYWQTTAGLPSKQPLKMPVIQQWEIITDEEGEEVEQIRVVFSSAAASEQQQVQYGIRIVGFGEQGGLPVSITTGLVAEGKRLIETNLDIRPLRQELQTFYVHIQIWALEPESKQIMYTPYYINWFSYDHDSKSIKPMTLPLDKQGIRIMLKNEGMDRWPLVLMYLNGKPYNAVRKYNENGVDYIPLRLFSEGEEANSSLNNGDDKPVDVQFQRRSVQVRMNQEQAMIDGKSVKLKRSIKKMGMEPVVPVSELPELFGVAILWDGEDSGMIVQTDTP